MPRLFLLAALGYFLSTDNSLSQSLVQVSTGYYDVGPGSGGSNLPLPNPWNGSPNTVFFGSNAILSSGDPDVNAILLQNLGTSPLTLSALNVGGTIDLFSSPYDNITGTVTLSPGINYIFEGFDGSDVSFTGVVKLTLNSQLYSYNDAINATYYPNGVLYGFPSSTDETIPWIAIYTPIPEPATYTALFGLVALGFAAYGRRRRQLG